MEGRFRDVLQPHDRHPIEQALRLDAACVVVNLFRFQEEPEVTDQCIQNIFRIKPESIARACP